MLFTVVALWLAWRDSPTATGWTAARLHHWMGWAVAIAVAAQLANGFARGSKGGPSDAQMRGDHYDMTPRRVAFERVHKSLGWITLVTAWLATVLGLWVADAPRWMVAGVLLWWLVLATLWVRWQRAGRCVDTYQAIWGTAPDLPGLTRPPIGWGVRRYTPQRLGSEVGADRNASARNKGN